MTTFPIGEAAAPAGERRAVSPMSRRATGGPGAVARTVAVIGSTGVVVEIADLARVASQ